MSQQLNIGLVASHEVDYLWPKIAQQMQHACEKSDQDARYKLNAGDLWQMCRSGNGFLIVGYDDPEKPFMASVWRFEDTPTVFKCMMLYGPGMKRWFRPLTEYVTDIAKENGAVALVSQGRRGWQRVFKDSENYEIEVKL